MKKGILFDLDGTLWDSSREVAASWEEALKKRGIEKPITTEMLQSVMGKSMIDIADILFDEYDLETRRELLKCCCEEENEYIRCHGGRLSDGLEEMLKSLKEKGYFLFIVSNCQKGYIEAFLEYHKLGKYFDDFESYENTGKEKGANIHLVATRNHLDKAVYIGDTQGDYDAAREAGLPFIHARTGYGRVQGDVPYITELSEVLQVVDGILHQGNAG